MKSFKMSTAAKIGFGVAALGVTGLSYGQSSGGANSNPLGANEQSTKNVFANIFQSTSAATANLIGLNASGVVAAPGIGPGALAPGVNRFALSGGQTGAAGAAGAARWNGWFALSQNNVEYSFQPLRSSGRINTGTVGVDYTLDNRMVLGVAVTGDRSDIALNFNGGKMTGNGWTVSPYLGVPLTRNLALDATLGFGRANVDANAAGVNASIKSDRTIGSIGLTYRENIGNWQLSGRGAFLSVSDKLGAYTLSNGTFVQGGSVDVQQLRLGGQAGYRMGNVTPYVGLTYIYDIRRPDQQPVAGQTAANDRDAWTPTIGLRFSSGGALYGGIQYSSEQSRSQVKNNQVLFNLGLRF